jgi:tetratricopeptide (TPR) repeat protein
VGIIAAACSGAPGDTARLTASAEATAVEKPGATDATAGFGEHHHPIQTTSPEAQRLFDQGMALAYGFNHEEAIRSFQRAAALDPKAAMPHWGRAWALGPNYNLDIDDPRAKQAFEAIDVARQLAAQGPEHERADEAERVFREDLERNPRNPRSLFGLQASLAKQGRNADAAWVQRELEEAWKNAETTLTLEGL